MGLQLCPSTVIPYTLSASHLFGVRVLVSIFSGCLLCIYICFSDVCFHLLPHLIIPQAPHWISELCQTSFSIKVLFNSTLMFHHRCYLTWPSCLIIDVILASPYSCDSQVLTQIKDQNKRMSCTQYLQIYCADSSEKYTKECIQNKDSESPNVISTFVKWYLNYIDHSEKL